MDGRPVYSGSTSSPRTSRHHDRQKGQLRNHPRSHLPASEPQPGRQAWWEDCCGRTGRPGLRLPFSVQAQDALLTNTWGQQGPWEEAKNCTACNERTFPNPWGPVSPCPRALGTHRLAPKHSPFSKAHAKNQYEDLWPFHVTVIRNHRHSLSWGLGLGTGRLGPLSHPHIRSGLSLATLTQTNSLCSPPFLNLRFLVFLLLIWPLRITGLALYF